jgi:RNA polymerase sigma-70 factor (ECF subfamily)
VNAVEASKPQAIDAGEIPIDLEAVFERHYARITRAVAAVIRDPGRAEELAVEVFLKWKASNREDTAAWLYRVAVRMALDELRRQSRRSRYDRLLAVLGGSPAPDAILSAEQEGDKVRAVLSSLPPRYAEMLILRNQDQDYNEIASALNLNPASVGTLLSRAQQAFRKEYVKKYGEQ